MRLQKIALLGLIVTALAVGTAWADTSSSSDSKPATSSSETKPPTPKKAGRDPVAAAFQLPRGKVLNDKQQAAYDDLKAKYEPALREAMDLIASSDPKDKSKGLKLNRDTRTAIRAGIKQIVSASSSSSGGQQATSSSGSNGYNQASGGGSSAGYGPQGGGYSGSYGPPMSGGPPMTSGGGMMRGNCRGR